MAYPSFQVYAAFGSKPTDATFNYTTNVSSHVRQVHYQRGRQHERNRIEAGTSDIVLNDKLRYFDPDNTYGPYYPNVVPMVPIQARAVLSGQTYTVLSHFVERWPRKRQGRTYAERAITAVDGFELLSHAGVGGAGYGVQLTGARISALLDTAGWPAALRSISTGNDAVPSASFTNSDTSDVLSNIQPVEDTENGLFFINAAGKAVFLDRHTWVGAPYSTSQGTFTDVVILPGEFPYADIVPSSDKDLIFNDWRGTRSGGSTQIAQDAASIATYFRRTQQVTSLCTSDATVLSQMQYKLAQYKDPLQRVESILLRPGNNTALWLQCLQREIGDRITVKEHPPGFGPATVRDYLIQSIDATIKAGPATTAEYRWGLYPADTNAWLVLDSPTAGKLDSNRLGY